MDKIIIKTWEDLQVNVKTILNKLEADGNLTLAAAANPIFALEEMGYGIDPNALEHLEDRMRFPSRESARLDSLRNQIFKLAGKQFNLRLPLELHEALFEHLGIQAYDESGCKLQFQPERFRKRVNTPTEADPLEKLARLHPIIEPLLRFRKIDASAHAFASREAYEKIRRGETKLQGTLIIHPRLKASGSEKEGWATEGPNKPAEGKHQNKKGK
ncbi:MAG: hypothetical protein EOP06_17135 [Proteobacteria bacterium]|nr:MAG: hypothetical protein EOP06_17135 [Pseudomonadota bacterium]